MNPLLLYTYIDLYTSNYLDQISVFFIFMLARVFLCLHVYMSIRLRIHTTCHIATYH